MVICMKTTLNIHDEVMNRLKREAARQGRTMSELVETALRLLFQRRQDAGTVPELPVFSMGVERVDVSNRDALYDAMDED